MKTLFTIGLTVGLLASYGMYQITQNVSVKYKEQAEPVPVPSFQLTAAIDEREQYNDLMIKLAGE